MENNALSCSEKIIIIIKTDKAMLLRVVFSGGGDQFDPHFIFKEDLI